MLKSTSVWLRKNSMVKIPPLPAKKPLRFAWRAPAPAAEPIIRLAKPSAEPEAPQLSEHDKATGYLYHCRNWGRLLPAERIPDMAKYGQEGMEVKGLSIFKEVADPKVKARSAYPQEIFRMLLPPRSVITDEDVGLGPEWCSRLEQRILRRYRKAKIRETNTALSERIRLRKFPRFRRRELMSRIAEKPTLV